VARLRAQARAATAAARPALDRELAAATNRLDLRRLQLDFATKLSELDGGGPDDAADVPDQRSRPCGTPFRSSARLDPAPRRS